MIALQPISVADTDFMMELVQDPKTTKYVPGLITDPAIMRDWIETLPANDHEFIVLLGDEPIGECNLTVNGANAEIGFLLLSKYWRCGYGTEMMHQLLELAEQLNVAEITATTDRGNAAAIGLLRKFGFERQNIGWFLRIPEDEKEPDLSEMGQCVVTYGRKMN